VRSLVIDSSVAIKWVVQEQGTQQALALRRYRLSAPDLLTAECANVLWKKVRRGDMNEAEAVVAAGLLELSDVELVPMRGMLAQATTLALDLDHPAYDCLYLVLAQSMDRHFVTADERLVRKVRDQGRPIGVSTLDAFADFH